MYKGGEKMKISLLFNIITLIFITAKVFGFISWSWWLVFSPTLIVFGLLVLLLAILGIVTYVEEKL